MSLTSFPPGTKVFARAQNNKYIWRPAKVVEPPPDQPPNTITVTFVGRTEQVHLPVRNVKLPPNLSNDTVDLTDDTDPQHESPPQVQQTAPLPTFSDPYKDSPQQTTTVSQSADQPASISLSSHPGTDTPHLQSDNPLVPHESIPESTKQSSRDWLLARPSTQGDRNPETIQSEPRFRPPQRQPQVVSDPSFPRPQHPSNPHPRGNPSSLSWDTTHQRPVSAEPQQPMPFSGHEQNFVPFAQKELPSGFQFKAVRNHTEPSSQTLNPSLSREPTHRAYIPSKSATVQEFPTEGHRAVSASWAPSVDPPVTSTTRSVWSGGSSKPLSPVLPRNGLTPRNPERHSRQSLDERFRIPRTTIPKDLPRVPRHPQSSFDDDVPIPRNALPRRMDQDGDDTGEANDLHPAYKRQRLEYRYMPWCQMPPSAEVEAAMYKFSRRLAKREREQGWNHGQSSRERLTLRSLPYQCPVQPENGFVRITLGFDSPQTFANATSSEETSDVETKLLGEVFADLSVSSDSSVNSDDVDKRHHDTVLSQTRRTTASLVVRGGGRKKGNPKKWRGARSDDIRAMRASSEFNFWESGVSGSFATSGDSLDSSMREQKDIDNCPIPRVYGCACQDGSGERRPICNDRYSIQCCMCTLWFHMECIGFEPGDIKDLLERTTIKKEKYLCVECVDLSSGSSAGTSRHRLLETLFHEGAKWISSSVHNLSHLLLGLSLITTDTLLHSNLGHDKCIRRCFWIREPLVQDEISARVNNLEQLREGLANPSVGTRERALFDEHLGERRQQSFRIDICPR